jgi:hypothetical protein
MATAEESLKVACLQQALGDALAEAGGLSESLAALVAERFVRATLLQAGGCTLEEVADELQTSSRTLKRDRLLVRATAEGSSLLRDRLLEVAA